MTSTLTSESNLTQGHYKPLCEEMLFVPVQ